jgi:dynein heavy chain
MLQQLSEQVLLSQRSKVSAELLKIRQRCEEFYEYVEPNVMHQYVQDVRAVQKRLADVSEQIQWIHREEQLYKQPLSEFSDVEEVGGTLELFYRLFLVVSKWQKAEKRLVFQFVRHGT